LCGRFLLSVDIEELLERYRIAKGWVTDDWAPEIFPSNVVPIVTNQGVRELRPLKWGLVPPYTKGLIINSRGETVDSKPMFRRAFRRKRCIIPANAFFEWQRAGKSSAKHKVYLKQQSIFSMAGIYDNFLDNDGKAFTAFSILTTTPNSLVAQIHDRMPVILPIEVEDIWLDPMIQDFALLKSLICPYDESQMAMEKV